MEFPTLVYKCPGMHQRQGGTYDYATVNSEGELAQAKQAGWHATLPEAIAAHDKPTDKVQAHPASKKASVGTPAGSWGG